MARNDEQFEPMNRRRALATLVVALLAVTAGCSAIFGGISDEELDREAEYDDLRESTADVAIDLESGGLLGGGEFRAVYDLNGTEELSLYRTEFYSEQALEVYGVRYWYPNGTEVTGSDLDVEQGRSATTVGVPDGNGTLAFSGGAGRKSFVLPAYVSGSYEVTVPESHRTSNFLFGNVNPAGFEREVVDDRERVTWEAVDSPIHLRYYQTRDIPLFVGLIGVALTLGGIGIAYYYRQIAKLQEQRDEYGLDVDTDDESNGGPPPGFK